MFLTNARVIDGTGRPPYERASLPIAGGRVADVTEVDVTPPDGALDLEGRTILPGRIDPELAEATAGGIR